MKEFLMNFINNAISSNNALLILFVLSFAESSFFPIPPDTLMIPLALMNPKLAIFYAFLTTVSSVLGGVFGYFIGLKGGRPLVKKFISDEKLYQVKLLYQKYDVWAVIIAGFSPIPYKIFTIAAGLFELDLKRFVIASFIGRGGRFFLVGTLIFIFGEKIKYFLTHYLEWAIIGITVLFIGGFVVVNKVLKKSSSFTSEK
ncbi:MAG: DedA family protein [Patescibacteria group bacterium]|nr:DedA family protein [Patescibacteria group bacterium]